MRKYFVRPYEPRHAEKVAALMARTREERRRHCELLPPGLDDASAAMKILQGLKEGAVAVDRDGNLGGFLFARRQEDQIWGDSIVADIDAWALVPDIPVSTLAELYTEVFQAWTTGTIEHKVLCPSFNRDWLEAWFHLGFGMEQAYAAASLEDIVAESPPIEGLNIRRAQKGDEETLAALSPLIATMQAGPPIWAGAPASYLADIREGFIELATDTEAIVLLAFRDHKALGYQAWFPMAADPSDGAVEGGIELSVGATMPEARGGGVGLALTARGVQEARKAGYSACFIDWRTTNPLASAFWQARGFKPFLYRLARRIKLANS